MSNGQISILMAGVLAAGLGIGAGIGGIGTQPAPDGGVILVDAGPPPAGTSVDLSTGALKPFDAGSIPLRTISVPISPLWPDGGSFCVRFVPTSPVGGMEYFYCVEGL